MASPQIRLTYARKGENFFGRAEVPTPNGMLKFHVLVPMADIKKEVADYLRQKAPEIAGDPHIAGNLPRIHNTIAHRRAKRRLGTAIKAKLGGSIKPYEIAGPAGYAHRIAKHAANKAAMKHADANDIGVSLGGIFKSIGRGVKAVGKGVGRGTVAVAKGVGRGAVATGKGVGKAANVVTKNPITRALVSVVPGGVAAIAISDAARGGSPGAQQAIDETFAAARNGNPTAEESARRLREAGAKESASKMPLYLAAGGLAALILLKK